MKTTLAIFALAVLLIVPILAAPVMRAPANAPAVQCDCILDDDQ